MIILAGIQLAAILILVGVLIWHILHTERAHSETVMQLLAAQDMERQDHRNQLRALVEEHSAERRVAHPDLSEMVALIDRVCQRLQAPEQAVIEHAIGDHPSPPAVPPDDDIAYWEAQKAMLDKTELADLAMEAELSG